MKRLSIPKVLAISAVVAASVAGCPRDDGDESPCAYICTSDAALAISKSDMFGGEYEPTFDLGTESCHATYC